mgnify:CR=1 FL=1
MYFLQEEHPHEVARGFGLDEARDRAGLGLEGRGPPRAMARPEVDDRVGRGVVVPADTRGHLLLEHRLDERAHDWRGQRSRHERGAPRRRRMQGKRTRGGVQLRARHEPVHEPEAQRLAAAQRLAREHHVERCARSDQAHRAHGAAKARVDAELHFGQAKRDLVVVGRDAVAASERQLEPAAEREAVDGGHCGAGQGRKAVEHSLARADQCVRILLRRERHELVDVGARDEAARLAGTHDHRPRPCRFELAEQAVELLQHRLRQDIGRGGGLVERQGREAFGVALEGPAGGGGHVSS